MPGDIPADIWILIAGLYLIVSDIIALCWTCRGMYEIIGQSATVWHKVTKDLLSHSPNPFIYTYTDQIPLGQLRNMILRFQRLNDWLTLSFQSTRTVILDNDTQAMKMFYVPSSVLEVCLIPGISAFMTISSLGQVTVVSEQGEILDSWKYPGRIGFSQATITLSNSKRHGPLLLFICDLLPSSDANLGFDRYVWLFTVIEGSDPLAPSKIQLVPISTGPVSRYVEFASARDGTLLYSWEGKSYEGVSIIDIGRVVNHTAQAEEVEYRLPVYVPNQMINQINILCNQLICICTDTAIYLFRIPHASIFTGTDSANPPELIPHWNMDTLHLGAADLRVHLGPLTSSPLGDDRLSFSVGNKIYIGSFSQDVSGCSLTSTSNTTKTWSDFRDISSFQGRCCVWCPSLSTGVPNSHECVVTIHLCFFLALKQTASRLRNITEFCKSDQEVERVAIQISCPPGMNVWSLWYDEWRGTILIHWWRDPGVNDNEVDEGGSEIMIIQLAKLARAASAKNPHHDHEQIAKT